MLQKFIVSAASILLMTSNVQAALLTSIGGTVMVNNGDGFWEVSGSTVVNAGDRVLVRGEGGAQIDYGDGCVVNVPANHSLVVSPAPTCDKSALYTASTTSGGGSLKDPPIAAPTESGVENRVVVVGGLIVAAGVVAAIALGDDDKPASP